MATDNNINFIASVKSKSRLDEDYQRRSYIINDEINQLVIYSKAPQLYTLQDVLFTLLYNSKRITLENQYYQRPDLLSYDEYGDESLWYILLFVNNCFCFEEFVGPKVLVPSYESITSIVSQQVPDKDIIETILTI